MRKIKIAYWTVTILFSLSMLFSAILAVAGEKETAKFITEHYGYPDYFVFYSGIVKILGVAAILIPGFPRLKEWAYAGLAFDLISVVYSSLAVGDSVVACLPMLVYFALIAGSYVLYRKRRTAADETAAKDHEGSGRAFIGAGI
ncbi:DoxX family protein [Cohnella sp. CFH 77786]|uniref:DoxX family protein n=1 Tax=Cohnella sp. CFH 77786 TaxID=2662265 RepID=UPI00351CC1BF